MIDREFERTNVAVAAILESSAGKRESRISDLSFGGCYVESLNCFRPGEEIALDLTANGAENIGFKGEIAYVLEGYGFGMRFINLGAEQLNFLLRVLPEYV